MLLFCFPLFFGLSAAEEEEEEETDRGSGNYGIRVQKTAENRKEKRVRNTA